VVLSDLKMQLMEKYLHSQGSAFCQEGRVDEAIIFLEQAVALEDRSYTRCQLGLFLKEKGDLGRALEEMGRAIALNPLIARYYYEKSLILHMSANRHEAQLALQKAIDIDENYARIDEIREAIDTLEKAASPGIVAASLVKDLSNNPVYKEIAALIQDGAVLAIQELDSVSCTLPCPAFCCYFEGSPVLHGLSLGPWKLLKVREFLRQKGLEEDQFLDKVDLTGDTKIQRLIPPHHLLNERGHSFVYSPKKGRSRIDPAVLASLPKGRGYQDLIWIHENSWECSFLRNRRCLIHDLGDEPALPACKEFLCLTGFVFLLLTRWGLIEEETVKGRSMEALNRLAVEAALLVSRELCKAQDLNRIKASMEEAVREGLCAKRKGASESHDQVVDLANRISSLHDELKKAVTERKTAVRRQVETLIEGASNPV